MAKLPTREDLGPLPSARTGRPIATYRPQVPDLSIAARGQQAAAQGLQDLGRGFAQMAASFQKAQDEEDALGVLKAKAAFDMGHIELEREIKNNPDHQSWDETLTTKSEEIKNKSLAMIPPHLQEEWGVRFQLDQAQTADRVLTERTAKERQQKSADLIGVLETHRRIHLDPNATPEEKTRARVSMAEAIAESKRVGIITPAGELELDSKYTKGVIKEAAEIEFKRDPEGLSRKLSFGPKAPVIMQRLMDEHGLTKEQAAGVLGNLGHESGGFAYFQEIDPVRGKGGLGWAQWTGPRRVAFLKWAEANNLDPRSDEANYGFLSHELKGEFAPALAEVKKARSADEAMLAFERTYEKSGVKAYGSRRRYSQAALAAFDGQTPNEYADLDPVDRAELEAKTGKALEDRVKVGSVFEASMQLADPTKVWDPTDPDDKKRIDALFSIDDGASRMMQRDQEFFDGIVVPLVQRTDMIPRDARGSLAAMTRSSDAATVTWALAAMDSLEQMNPETFRNDMGEDAVKKVLDYRSDLSLRKPEEIVEKLQRSEDPSLAKARQEAEKVGREFAAKVSDKTIIDHFDPSIFVTGPSAPEDPLAMGQLRAEFERVYAEEYARNGNPEKAEENAFKLIDGVWGQTELGGARQIMRRPPERYYPAIDGSHAWMAEQAMTELGPLIAGLGGSEFVSQIDAATGLMTEALQPSDATFWLRADAQTDSEIKSGAKPSYRVVVRDKDGNLISPPIRYRFDPKPYIERRHQQFRADQSMASQMLEMEAEGAAQSLIERRVGF